jgi:hypothetical protein
MRKTKIGNQTPCPPWIVKKIKIKLSKRSGQVEERQKKHIGYILQKK